MSFSKNNLIAWFIRNHVAANLLMIFLLFGGYLTLKNTNTEVFPIVDPKIISVNVFYRGASPFDIEEAITQPIEEAILGVQGVKRISSKAIENTGSVTLELEEGSDPIDVYNDVRNKIDSIPNFPPQDAERPVITRVKPRGLILKLAVFGDTDKMVLRDYAEKLEQELLSLPKISDVSLQGGANREINIFVNRAILSQYNLSHQEIGQKISASALNVPAGKIETQTGDILLRVNSKRYFAKDYANIVIKALDNGTLLRLKDIAKLEDRFDDKRIDTLYNGQNALFVSVYKNETQDVLKLEQEVIDYLKTISPPSPIKIDVQYNRTDPLKDRINLMVSNAISGFILLFIVLLLFLDLKLSLWISMGIPISVLGGLLVASFFGLTINMISLFAMIIVIGVVVDDAIVVGESVFYEQETYPQRSAFENVYKGVVNVMAPAMMGVLTTIVAFVPLMFTEGDFGQILGVIPVIVISILFVSMIESFFILPSHLSNPSRYSLGPIKTMQIYVEKGLFWFISYIIVPIVTISMKYRYVAITAILCLVFITISAVKNGLVRTVFFPTIESSQISVKLEMPIETSYQQTFKQADYIYQKALETLEHFKKSDSEIRKIHENIVLSVGESLSSDGGPSNDGGSQSSQNVATIEVKLVEPDNRNFSSLEFEQEWRERIGKIDQAKNISFASSLIRSNNDLQLEVSAKDSEIVKKVSSELTEKISQIQGVVSVKDSYEPGKIEYRFSITPAGYAAGLTEIYLGQQIRSSFNGAEALRVRRGRNEIRVVVRFTPEERQTLSSIENYLITLPNGQKAPLLQMVSLEKVRGDTEINRVNGQRINAVLGDVDETITTTDEVIQYINNNIIPQVKEKYPDFSYSFEGDTKERQQDTASLQTNSLLAILIIFSLIAIQLGGYLMPFVIVAIIPVGITGAVLGHWIMGYDLSFMSFFGIVALTGVVVNDAIVLLDYYKQLVTEGINHYDAMVKASIRRFRPILLTSLTTSISTFPLILETSTQAQFLIPMAISIAFGILFATFMLFAFAPPLMTIAQDIKNIFKNVSHKKSGL